MENLTNTAKFLIASPALFYKSYISENFGIARVFIDSDRSILNHEHSKNLYYYEVVILLPEPDMTSIYQGNYDYIGKSTCMIMSLLYGKRVEYLGRVELFGVRYMPSYSIKNENINNSLTFNSNSKRADYPIVLSLDKFEIIKSVMINYPEHNKELLDVFWTSLKFYHLGLINAEKDPELAYLYLITSAEVIAGNEKFDKNEIFNNEIIKSIEYINNISEAAREALKPILNCVGSISQSICKSIMKYLNDDFFYNSENNLKPPSLTKEEMNRRIKSAYSIRSKYLHAGIGTYGLLSVNNFNSNDETFSYIPSSIDSQIKRALKNAPTLIGMERIIRSVLIGFLLKNKIIKDFK